MMGRRSLSPILKKELEKNLDLDMKSCEGLSGPSSEDEVSMSNDTILLDEVGVIIGSIIKTLKSSTKEELPLNFQSCSRAVSAIARYGIGPTATDEMKRNIIHSIAKPLSDCLLTNQEAISSGAALCLKSLVDSDNWRFASSKIVNQVCQAVSGALEMHNEIGSHMALVMSLAKHNSLILEAYARLLIQCGLHVLRHEKDEKQFLAVVMINCLMSHLDPKSLLSEMGMVVEELVACQESPDKNVRFAVFETLQVARTICSDAFFEPDYDSTLSWPSSTYAETESSTSKSLEELGSFRRDEPKPCGSFSQNHKSRMVWVFLILGIAFFLFLLWGESQDGVYSIVPT